MTKVIFAILFAWFAIPGYSLSLHDKQASFAHLLPQLIIQAESMGYEVTLGEAWRSDVVAQWYAEHGKGITNSLHTKRLAIDLILFKNGVFLTKTEDYEPLGIWWEKQSTKDYRCAWGGRFPHRKDGNHFSIEHEGVRSGPK